MVLALLLTLVPIVVMSFAKDKVERYLLPMAAPAAVLAAGAVVDWFRSDRRDPRGRLVEAVHWATLIVFALAPATIALSPQTFGIDDGKFDPRSTLAFAAAALLLLGLNLLRRHPTPSPSPGTPGEGRGEGVRSALSTQHSALAAPVRVAVLTAATVLLLQYPVIRGYSHMSTSDLKPLADAVWARYPDALLYEYEPGTRTRTYLDLPIYAGRLSHKVNDPAALAAKDRPQVVVFFNRHGDPPPLPPTWQELASGGGRKDGWKAYVLPAAR
jgi:4-amino-4-deoxy-L-arabinose transferase-like glycosyltransferase